MKRNFSFFLIGILLFLLPMPVFAASNNSADELMDFATAYLNVLDEYQDEIKNYKFGSERTGEFEELTGGTIAIMDITGDDIPELFFLYPQEDNRWYNDLEIWTYKNGEAKILLKEKDFDRQVGGGSFFSLYTLEDGAFYIHCALWGEGCDDRYSKYEYKSGKLIEKQKLKLSVGPYYNSEEDSTNTTGRYNFKAELTSDGKTTSISDSKCADLINEFSAELRQMVISNYWPDERNPYFYRAMQMYDSDFGDECWKGNTSAIVENFTYEQAVEYLQQSKKAQTHGWSEAYRNFVLNSQYLLYEQEFSTESEPLVSLHDMDKDGTPELLMTNGETARVTRMAYIYTYCNGIVQYLGIGPTDAYYIEDSVYPGIWGAFNMSPDINWTYYSKNGVFVEGEHVCYETTSGSESVFQQETEDDELFAEAQKEKENMYRRSISEIREMGWDTFVENAVPDIDSTGFGLVWIYVFIGAGVIVCMITIVVVLGIRKNKNRKKRQPSLQPQVFKQNTVELDQFCSVCGTPFAENALFCAKCGNARKGS